MFISWSNYILYVVKDIFCYFFIRNSETGDFDADKNKWNIYYLYLILYFKRIVDSMTRSASQYTI